MWGRGQVEGGVVIDMSGLDAVTEMGTDRVTVGAGATWTDLLATTLPQGLTPPVLPEYPGLSVGGTLAVGGVGATTSTFGAVSDTVVEMDVVTGRGEAVRCSASIEAELFDMVRAGLGQVALIVRVTLRLVPAPRELLHSRLFYPDLGSMVRDASRLAEERSAAVTGAVTAEPGGGWTFRLDVATPVAGRPPDDALWVDPGDDPARRQRTTVPYLDHLRRLDALEAALRAAGRWHFPHPWLTTFLPAAAVEPMVEGELDRLTPAAELGSFGQVVLSPLRRRSVTSPLLRLPSDEWCFAFNLVRLPDTADPAVADRLVRDNRAIYDRIRTGGGMLYAASAFPMSAGDWRDHFGPVFERLHRAKQKFDPDMILTPGYEIFGVRTGA